VKRCSMLKLRCSDRPSVGVGLLLLAAFVPNACGQTESAIGKWHGAMTWPFRAVHMIMLRTGEVFALENTQYIIFTPNAGDPTQGTFRGLFRR